MLHVMELYLGNLWMITVLNTHTYKRNKLILGDITQGLDVYIKNFDIVRWRVTVVEYIHAVSMICYKVLYIDLTSWYDKLSYLMTKRTLVVSVDMLVISLQPWEYYLSLECYIVFNFIFVDKKNILILYG